MKIRIVILLLCSLHGFAQRKHNFAVQGGLLLGRSTSFYTSAPYVDIKQPYKIGYHIGMIYDYNFYDNFGLRTGLDYSYSRRKIRIENANDFFGIYTAKSVNEKNFLLNSLQVPLHFYYRIHSPYGNFKILLGIGYQLHLNGRFRETEEVTRTTNLFINQVTVTKSSTMGRLQFRDVPDNPDSKYRYHRRRNLSLNLGFVYEYYRFLVEVKYEFGLANQLALPASKDSEVVTDRYNTSTLGLSLGYYLK